MAIDDNTTYGLTGAQLKELPGKIDEAKGMAKELTTDDYNFDTGGSGKNNCVATWLLPDGLYKVPSGVPTLFVKNGSYSSTCIFLKASGPQYTSYICLVDNGVPTWTQTHIDGRSQGDNGRSLVTNVYGGLDSVSSSAALSAGQGHVLKGLIDDINDAGYQTADEVATIAAAAGASAIETVNDTLSYSTEEVDTGTTWIDGSTIYKKTVDLGTMPNGQKNTPHGVSGIDTIVKVEGFMTRSSDHTTHPLPRVSDSSVALNVNLFADGTNVVVVTGSDNWASGGYVGYATIYYTKSS